MWKVCTTYEPRCQRLHSNVPPWCGGDPIPPWSRPAAASTVLGSSNVLTKVMRPDEVLVADLDSAGHASARPRTEFDRPTHPIASSPLTRHLSDMQASLFDAHRACLEEKSRDCATSACGWLQPVHVDVTISFVVVNKKGRRPPTSFCYPFTLEVPDS